MQNYFLDLRERIKEKIDEFEKSMLTKCSKFIEKKAFLQDTYNKMAEKEILKQYLEDQTNSYETISELLDHFVEQKHQQKIQNT